VIVESYYSMDADSPDIAALAVTCAEQGAGLLVDEAHAVGVFGPSGRGLCAALGLAPEARVIGLGKALGLSGGLVVSGPEIRTWLWNRARSFVFSTGASPVIAREAQRRLNVVARADAAREILHARAKQLRAGLSAMGLDVRGHGPIIPVVLGDVGRTVEVTRRLADRGLLVQAIRPPSVPQGSARIRMTVNATLTEADVDLALGAWRDAV
jgi:8-amino-7-oxononanoate synthase